jgi:hypothetical protein
MRNRILTRYSPLGSGSGPIGALLMGSRTNWIAIILLNSLEWFEAALCMNRYYSCVLASIVSRLRDTSVVDNKSIVPKSSTHSSTDGDLSHIT